MAGLSSPQKQIMTQLLSLTHFEACVVYSDNSASETVSREVCGFKFRLPS